MKIKMNQSAIDLRDAFFDELYRIASNDHNLVLITADMGAQSLLRFKKDLPRQYINIGIAEQNMVSVAAGLALAGKKVFIYTIIPFLTMRCYEQIKVDLCCMNLPVVMVGIGPGFTYGSDGPTHHAIGDIAIMRALPGITIFSPADYSSNVALVNAAYRNSGPTYIRIDKGKFPVIYDLRAEDFRDGLKQLAVGSDVTIISTGVMVHNALWIAQHLKNNSFSAAVVDLYRLKPLNANKLLKIINNSTCLITLEEHSSIGGLGSAIAEFLADNQRLLPLKRFAARDEHLFIAGDRGSLQKHSGLDNKSVLRLILSWLKKLR